MKSILTLTLNPCVDISSHVEEVMPEDKLRCEKPQYDPGGGGINVSRVLKTLGGDSLAVYCGGGPTGYLLEELLERESLERKLVKITAWTRQSITILEAKSNQQFRFNMPGPTLMESEWQQCLDIIFGLEPAPSYIVVSGSIPKGVPTTFIAQLTRQFKGNETRLIVDTSEKALQHVVKEGVFLLKPNLWEFSKLLNRKQFDDHDLEESCREFIDKGFCEKLILSLGESGALLASSGEVKRIIAPKVTSKSKIGAGDSMVAGIIFGLANDYTLSDSAILGVAAGTAAVLTEGTELCRENDVWNFYREMKRRSDEH
jgi:6-phosphofructokinase 2